MPPEWIKGVEDWIGSVVEWAGGLAPFASIIIAGVIGASIIVNVILSRKDRKQTKEHISQTHQTESARLILELQKNWKDKNKFTAFIAKLEDPNSVFPDNECDEHDVHYALGIFEDIAILRKDGTLTETHVREFFGTDIVRIDANKSTRKMVDDYHEENPEHNYNNLVKMLNDSKKWGMSPY